MKTVEILEKAREKIAEESKWTKGALARTATGARITKDDGFGAASCFCSVGAVRVICPEFSENRGQASFKLWQAVNEGVADEALKRVVAVWNDATETTHADVLRVFDRAIELAKAEAA